MRQIFLSMLIATSSGWAYGEAIQSQNSLLLNGYFAACYADVAVRNGTSQGSEYYRTGLGVQVLRIEFLSFAAGYAARFARESTSLIEGTELQLSIITSYPVYGAVSYSPLSGRIPRVNAPASEDLNISVRGSEFETKIVYRATKDIHALLSGGMVQLTPEAKYQTEWQNKTTKPQGSYYALGIRFSQL